MAASAATERPAVPSLCRSEQLLEVLADYERVLVLTHDNPDPDAIAGGWALKLLLDEARGRPVRFVAGGDVIRAENRRMMELLHPPIELLSNLLVREPTAAVLVDCGLGAGNHLLMNGLLVPVAVIDHHPLGAGSREAPFCDVRPEVAASVTIAVSYLWERAIEPGTELATAATYAIRSETRGFETQHSLLDRRMLTWLTERADPSLVAQIESAPMSREYFSDLVLALQGTFLYDDCAFCMLPRAEGPEIVGEVADLLIRCRSIRRVFCGAMYQGDLLVSARTERTDEDAAMLIRQTLKGLGFGGGHAHRAGGKIPRAAQTGRLPGRLREELRDRWLAACGVDRQRGMRLVQRSEIVQNL